MKFKEVKMFFWATFALSMLAILANFGLGLFAFGLFIVPVLMLHLAIAIDLNDAEEHQTSIVLSALNLLAFALFRPDGVHVISDNGLSATLGLFGINAGYSPDFEDQYFFASVVLLLIQPVLDIRLWGKMRKSKTSS